MDGTYVTCILGVPWALNHGAIETPSTLGEFLGSIPMLDKRRRRLK